MLAADPDGMVNISELRPDAFTPDVECGVLAPDVIPELPA